MTEQDFRETTGTAPLPRPRSAADDTAASSAPSCPWPEPWYPEPLNSEPGNVPRGARPRAEYWDVETARWRSRGPVLGDRTAG